MTETIFNRSTKALRTLALAAGAALLPAAPGAVAQPAAAPATLVVATYGGQAGAIIKDVYEGFEKQYNVSIRWAVGGSSAENVAKIAATRERPEYDLAFGDNMTYYTGNTQGLWAPIDESIVTRLKDQAPQAKFAGNDGVGYGFYLAGFLYNPAEFQKNGWAAPTRWDDLLRPELCGKIGIMHPNVMYGIHVLIGLAGGDPDKVPEAIAKLGAIRKCVQVLEPTTAKFDERIQMGAYQLSARGSFGSIALIEKGLPLRFVVPEQGSMVSFSTVAIVKGTKNMRLAQEFVNWVLRPEVQKTIMQKSFYNPTNTTVAVTPELLKLGVPDAATLRHAVVVPERIVTERRRDWIRQLERALEK